MNRSRIKNHIWRVIEKNIHLVDTWPLKAFLYVPEVEFSFTKALAPTKDV